MVCSGVELPSIKNSTLVIGDPASLAVAVIGVFAVMIASTAGAVSVTIGAVTVKL